jgi:hypothetical protein
VQNQSNQFLSNFDIRINISGKSMGTAWSGAAGAYRATLQEAIENFAAVLIDGEHIAHQKFFQGCGSPATILRRWRMSSSPLSTNPVSPRSILTCQVEGVAAPECRRTHHILYVRDRPMVRT